MTAVTDALKQFIDDYVQRYPDLVDVFDPEWRSPCETGAAFERGGTTVVPWAPYPRHHADDFSGLENALETSIHPDIKAYYGAYWSGGLEATAPDGHVSLLFLWNPADCERLIENLIGHAIAKQRAKAPFSVFFACTEPESDLFLAVDNTTGAVTLERPGYAPLRQVAESLGEFLAGLEPASPWQHPDRQFLTDPA